MYRILGPLAWSTGEVPQFDQQILTRSFGLADDLSDIFWPIRFLSIALPKIVCIMPIRTILKMGDERLLRVSEPVTAFNTPELQNLLQDLRDTMKAANGAGIAAPQIGVNLQVVIFGSGQINPRYPQYEPIPPTVLINPMITVLDDTEDEGWEGCLSVPGMRGIVPRPRKVRYQGCDEQGQPIDRVAEGFHARVVQHECDHLWGKLYPMRIRDFSRFGYIDVLFPEIKD